MNQPDLATPHDDDVTEIYVAERWLACGCVMEPQVKLCAGHENERAQRIEDIAYRLMSAMQHWHAIGALELGDDDYKYQTLIEDARAIDWQPVEYMARRLDPRTRQRSAG